MYVSFENMWVKEIPGWLDLLKEASKYVLKRFKGGAFYLLMFPEYGIWKTVNCFKLWRIALDITTAIACYC